MSLTHVEAALSNAQDISDVDIGIQIELETEDQSPDEWQNIAVGNAFSDLSEEELEKAASDASVEVSEGTDRTYRRLMRQFDLWIFKNMKQHIPHKTSIFDGDLPKATPLLIIAWIMKICDIQNIDGTPRDAQDQVSGYSHAMKMKASLSYGFGRHYSRSNIPWHFNSVTNTWEGNPSISTQVTRYMLSLKKRKFLSGDTYTMSSAAITSYELRKLHEFNFDKGRCDLNRSTVGPVSPKDGAWGNARRRLLVLAVAKLAFACLLRINEVLTLRFEDIRIFDDNHIQINLAQRKTHQYGGCKPFDLWMLLEEEQALCPLRALAAWIDASDLKASTGYIFRAPTAAGLAPPHAKAGHMKAESYIKLFRHNLIDIGISPMMYAGHSFRRGGAQWLVNEKRWPILKVCDWGGWSKDFNHSSIIKYLISLNDDPTDPRSHYFDPTPKPQPPCWTCGRTCSCGR